MLQEGIKNTAWKKMQLCLMFLEKKRWEGLSVPGKLSPVALWDADMGNLRVMWRISDLLPNGTAVSADN